jgi:putative DNA primase/helicase
MAANISAWFTLTKTNPQGDPALTTRMKITYDGSFDLATGRSRKEVNWKNKEYTWADFIERVQTTHRTAETLAEYMSSKKPRQDEIKDVGGFVGGFLSNGRRKTENVVHRQLVTLDIDLGTPGFWEDFTLLYDNAALLYSTHKHSPAAPRLRLIIPLDREVFSDEYVAIARRIAGVLGIEQFDHTTFEPTRLMYWPSTAKDGEYIFEVQDGPWLSADSVLATYRDWRDSSEWPMSITQDALIQRGIKKQGDPLEKPGIIGAFCRTHTISTAIDTYLADMYEPTDLPDRYTYRHGSTAAGLVVYDDKYAFSHHGTDPCSGKLSNAFDLVRLHLYGLQDEDTRSGTPINKLPSYLRMLDLCMADDQVRLQLGREKMADAKGDFYTDEPDEAPDGGEPEAVATPPADDSWLKDLEVDKYGKYHKTTNNINLILANDPLLKGRFRYNLFTKRELVVGQLPWRKVTKDTRYVMGVDMIGIRTYMETVYGIYHAQKVNDCLNHYIYKNAFHPVRDYLSRLVWDGTERIDTVMIDYLGAEDTPYTRTVTRKTLIAAVARIMDPGCKFDYVLTLVGPQGVGKSTIIKKLGKEWYCENLTTVQGKDAAELLQGVWLMEMGELAGLKKAEVEVIKNFISRQEDSFRAAYAEKKETHPRQCIFIGTTNNREFLRDQTGNRRFWPVEISINEPEFSVHEDLQGWIIDQLWAEAVEAYKKGEKLYLDKEINREA